LKPVGLFWTPLAKCPSTVQSNLRGKPVRTSLIDCSGELNRCSVEERGRKVRLPGPALDIIYGEGKLLGERLYLFV